jgi:uncharacterized protein YjbI with pentapeptide repeats
MERPRSAPAGGGDGSLRADCTRCFGLCCVAPAFAVSADFAIDKPAGRPCPHLQPDFRCGIHTDLRGRGFRGCATYDCFGAGQRVSQVTFGGRDWRQAPDTARQVFGVFAVMRQLHELLWWLSQARGCPAAGPLRDELAGALRATEAMTQGAPEVVLGLDLAAHRGEVNALLVRASDVIRAGVAGQHTDHAGADLIGARLRGARLRGACLRGAYLIAADLRDADLRDADLRGADLRDADLRGADLTGSLFLSQSQVDAANGDPGTKLPRSLSRPAHWRRTDSADPDVTP